MYAQKAKPHPETHLPKGPKPVFLRTDDIRNDDKKHSTGEEIYVALAKTLNTDNILGIQQIRRLWRIYLNSHEDRVKLISNGLFIRGASIAVYDVNPFTRSKDENLTRVTIKDVPLSVSDEVIRSKIENLKCQIQGDIYRQKLRVNGQLTNCLNGDRALYITPPSQPLPRKLLFGNNFMGRVYHTGQPEHSSAAGPVTCSRCLESGHHVSRCHNDVKCQLCKNTGHIKNECPQALRHHVAKPDASPPRQSTARGDLGDGQDSGSTQSAETANPSNRTRQTRLADFITKLVQQPSQTSDPERSEAIDLRSPMRTRSASYSAGAASASSGATYCTRSQAKTSGTPIRDDEKGAQQTEEEHDDEICSVYTNSGDEGSTLSPETPPLKAAGKTKESKKRKMKSLKKKKK